MTASGEEFWGRSRRRRSGPKRRARGDFVETGSSGEFAAHHPTERPTGPRDEPPIEPPIEPPSEQAPHPPGPPPRGGAHCVTARLGPRRIPRWVPLQNPGRLSHRSGELGGRAPCAELRELTRPRCERTRSAAQPGRGERASRLEVARLGDRCCADSTSSSGSVTLGEMREEATRPETRQRAIELPQPAVVLVGDAARDHQRVDDLLAADTIVILVPSLQTVTSLLPRGGQIAPAIAPADASVGELHIDLTQHRVLWGEHELPVTERELAILALLSQEPGRARTFAELTEPEGGKWLGDTERVRSAVRRLRRKLARAGADARIESVRGYGFRLVNSSVEFAGKNSPRAEGRD